MALDFCHNFFIIVRAAKPLCLSVISVKALRRFIFQNQWERSQPPHRRYLQVILHRGNPSHD